MVAYGTKNYRGEQQKLTRGGDAVPPRIGSKLAAIKGTPRASSTLGGIRAPVMKRQTPSPATHHSYRDSVFLVAIAAVSLICGAVSFFTWRAEHTASLTASVADDTPRVPLPAGPRKYQ